MTETMVNGIIFKVWSDFNAKCTLAENEDGDVRIIQSAGYISNDLTIRKAIAMVFGLPTFRKNAVKTAKAVEETPVTKSNEQDEQETVEGISKTETTTEMDDSEFEYTTSQAQEIIMTGTSIAKAEEQKTQFDFYNVTIGFEVEKFIGTIPADYESLGIYSDYYEKAVQAAQAAADEYGAENIYFRTVEIATRNDREVYDRDDYEDFIEERETIRHNWYTLTIVDTGKREHVNLNNPVRIDFKE